MDLDSESRHESVLNMLYEAALEPDSWPRALRLLTEWVGADAVMVVDGAEEARRVAVCDGHDDDYLAAYRRDWLQQDPRLAPTRTVLDETLASEPLAAFRRFERGHGFHGSFADRLAVDAQTRHWVLLSVRDEDAQSRVAIRYGRVRLHLERALRLTHRHAGFARDGAALASIADDMPLGVLLLDTDGTLRHANALGRAILDAEDSLQVRDGKLRALRRSDDDRLRQSLTEALNAGDGDSSGSSTQWLSMPRRGGESAYTLAVRTTRGADAGDAVSGDARCLRVVLGDGARLPNVSAGALSALFELTAREAQVCVRLLRGLCVDDTAADLGVSPRTARVYLQQVFLKLGVHRQADLVRLLMSCPALLAYCAPRTGAEAEVADETPSTGSGRTAPRRGLQAAAPQTAA